jgi:hypothetical protein
LKVEGRRSKVFVHSSLPWFLKNERSTFLRGYGPSHGTCGEGLFRVNPSWLSLGFRLAFPWLSLGFPLAFPWRESQAKAKRKPSESQGKAVPFSRRLSVGTCVSAVLEGAFPLKSAMRVLPPRESWVWRSEKQQGLQILSLNIILRRKMLANSKSKYKQEKCLQIASNKCKQ